MSRVVQLRWWTEKVSVGHLALGSVCLAALLDSPSKWRGTDVGKSLLDLEGLRLHCGCSLVGEAGEQALRLTLQVGPEQRRP